MGSSPETYIDLVDMLGAAMEPKDALYHTFRFLEKRVAFDTALLLFQDRAEQYLKVVLEYNKTRFQREGQTASSAKGRLPIGRRIFGQDYQKVYVSSGGRDPSVASGLPSLGFSYESIMSTLLHVDDNDNILMMLVFFSSERDFFSGAHAAMLGALRPALKRMTRPFFLRSSEDTVFWRAEGVLPASSEALLRQCPALRPMMRLVETVAPTESTVFIEGPTGAGKGLVAETLHMLSPRARSPFIQVNCAAIPENLLESELFGFERGAFTGAQANHRGYFEQANHGTLLLDELGELSLPAQAKLLQVLEKREIVRLGGERRIPVDVRLLAATHRDLPKMAAKGLFREDLLYRLRVFPVHVPPLKERTADIALLAGHFYQSFVAKMGGKAPRFLRASLRVLEACEWPGNVRQLSHCVERAVLTAMANNWPELRFDAQVLEGAGRSTRDTRQDIEAALEKSKGRIQGPGGAADILGLPPATVRSRMKKWGIALPRARTTKSLATKGASLLSMPVDRPRR